MEGPNSYALLEAIRQKQAELDALRVQLAGLRPRPPTVGSITVLKCRIAQSRVVFRVDQLHEVVAMVRLTPLPGAPPWVAGTFHIGDQALVAIDLWALETGERRRSTPEQLLAVMEVGGGRFACVLDELMDFAELEPSQLQEVPAGTPFAAHVVALAALADGPHLLLDAQPLMPPAGLVEEPSAGG